MISWTEMKNNNTYISIFITYNHIVRTGACVCKGYRGRANRHHHLFYGRHVIVGHTIAGWEATERNISDWPSDSRGRLRCGPDAIRYAQLLLSTK